MNLFDQAIAEKREQAEPGVQRYRMASPNPEDAVARAVLDSLEGRYHSLLEYLRARMAELYRRRLAAQGYDLARVTADDARHILDNDPRVPGSDRLNRNFIGQLFRGGAWESTGELIKSQTPGSHGNLLRCWRLKAERTRDDV